MHVDIDATLAALAIGPSLPQLAPWLALLGLGALHGVNPAMGWLFAVGIGLQEESRGAVWRALGPLALGHLAAMAAALLVAAAIGVVVPLSALKWIVAGALLAMGLFQLRRHWHPRYGGMRMRGRELAAWSFLMASAHGAGLMALPFVFGMTFQGSKGEGGQAGPVALTDHAGHAAPSGHGGHEALSDPAIAADLSGHGQHGDHALDLLQAGLVSPELAGLLGTALHTAGYLLVMGLVAVLVYEKLGLRLLRSAWINLNLIWAGALIVTAVLTPLL